jgi:hypothetical protein
MPGLTNRDENTLGRMQVQVAYSHDADSSSISLPWLLGASAVKHRACSNLG